MMRYTVWSACWLLVFSCHGTLPAAEPNETFAQATILAAGVTSVVDTISPRVSDGDFPDTMIAGLNSAGFIIDENNDGGPWEGALGSGLTSMPINNDSSFWFIVTGYPDFDYNGSHDQFGDYHVYVDIYNDFGEFEETYEFDETLEPGEIDQFRLEGFNSFYTYDVFIDNTVGGATSGDVDFYTFTGLIPGSSFTAEVTQETFDGFDSYLGWFSDTGTLIDTDDDSGGFGRLSLLEGIIPASGKLTFAVTGYGDEGFLGNHDENATYVLELSIGNPVANGDFDGDGDVDGRDFLLWQRGGSPSSFSAGDLALWRNEYGGTLVGVTAVPEPGTLGLVVAATCVGLRRLRRNR